MHLTRDSRKEGLRSQKAISVEVKVESRGGHVYTLSWKAEGCKKKVVLSCEGSFPLGYSIHLITGGRKVKKIMDGSFVWFYDEPTIYVSLCIALVFQLTYDGVS